MLLFVQAGRTRSLMPFSHNRSWAYPSRPAFSSRGKDMPSCWNYIFLLTGPRPIVIALCCWLKTNAAEPSSWLVINRAISPQRFLLGVALTFIDVVKWMAVEGSVDSSRVCVLALQQEQ
ncbi:hypothetical protein C8J57DRAFT_1478534 [Mycena rebaudengoi]|nr:hypothetical protein C8J57DRAFT_1478534 [Mycena rebaudengoi]